MNEPELLTKQRQALRAFRRTVAKTTRQEKEATGRVKGAATMARGAHTVDKASGRHRRLLCSPVSLLRLSGSTSTPWPNGMLALSPHWRLASGR